jgi:hypothetical protein
MKHDPPENILYYKDMVALSMSHHAKAINSVLEYDCPKKDKGERVSRMLCNCQCGVVWDKSYPFVYCSEGNLYTIEFAIKGAVKDLVADLTSVFSEVYTRRFSKADMDRLGGILVDKYVDSDDEEL